jgi:serine phosphatase RsbU (regulator of sigma subunit)
VAGDLSNGYPTSPSLSTRGPERPRWNPGAGLRNPMRVMAIVAVIGGIVTGSVSWTAWRTDRNNEHRLLEVQTRQAANVVTAAIASIQSPLQTALDIASATNGNALQFTRFMTSYTGSGGLFVAASLWQTTGATPALVVSTGPLLSPTTTVAALVVGATRSTTFSVTSIATASHPRIGYTLADSRSHSYAVYAERAIPANRRVPVESDSAFSDLHFATYLGATTNTNDLQTTDRPLNKLPMSGDTVRETIPFGDTSITLMTSPIGHLGGSLSSRLPWILLGGGILLTAAAGLAAGQSVRRRRDAERDAQTITGLYDRLDRLFSEQRTISETLQHALLPQTNPSIPNLEIATRYLAGAQGVDIGGDWYSIIRIDDAHFGFVVGDVSGRGVGAAAIMARVRFTLRAYLVEGHPPDVALQMCSRQLDIDQDGHFATVVVGVGDITSRQITLANAGHPNPLIVSGDRAQFVDTAVGPPLGVTSAASKSTSYESTTIAMAPGSMFLAFTDGLVERRGEDLDLGFRRLAAAATTPTGLALNDLLTDVLLTMTNDGTDDDIAILAFKWTMAEATRTNNPASPATTGTGSC